LPSQFTLQYQAQSQGTNTHFYLSSFLSAEEAMAAGEMGCHSATISHTVLNELASRIYEPSAQPGEGVPKPAHAYRDSGALSARLVPLLTIDPLNPGSTIALDKAASVDYLTSNGEALDAAIAADPPAAKRLKFALAMFTDGENRSKERVEKAMQATSA
jgi:transaldolase